MAPIQYPDNLVNKFRFVAVAALRCRQLQKGARPRISSRSKKYTTVAQEEVLAGMVPTCDGLPAEAPIEALEPDVEGGPAATE